MGDDDDLFLVEMLAQVVRPLDPVLDHPIQRHRRSDRRAIAAKGLPCSSLVPLDDREVLLPWGEHRECPRVGDIAWTAVEEEQHWVGAILPADCDPLLDAADLDEGFLV